MTIGEKMAALRKARDEVIAGGATASFFNFFQGRATAFAIVFAIVGIVGFLRGKDLTSFALFVTAVQGFVFAHSCKEDWNDYKHRQLDIQQSTTVTVNNPATVIQPAQNQ